MNSDTFKDIEKLETDLWEAADNLRANSKLTSSDYFMPVLGIIFLRHAANRFKAACRQIEADQTSGKMPKRNILPADYIARRSLYLPEKACYDWIMQQAAVSGADLPKLVTEAMTAIESEFEPLLGVLPKDYGIFETKVLEDLMRLFNSEQIKQATGDVFGRIYEYFLAKFSIQKAHDNGEFFTPSSIVQTIVNVIEPDHGTVFDPACGSGGMFVQSSHFIEHEGGDTAKKVVFYGQEKNRDTIRISKMNLAVHGLEGKIAEAITYYQDEHTLAGKCDFLMANPPFNVDLVDAERIKGDPRLPFGLPGVNKQKKVGNGNYLWISYFWSYLSAMGRARPVSLLKPGFVELPVSISSLEFLVVSGVVERQLVIVVPRLRVRARPQQRLHDFGSPARRRAMQRCRSAYGSNLRICARPQQRLHGFGMSCKRRAMQRCSAEFPCFQVRARVHQRHYSFGVLCECRVMQRGAATFIPYVRICAGVHQDHYSFGVLCECRAMQRGAAAFISRFQIRSRLQQRLHSFGMPCKRRDMQRGAASFGSRIGVRSSLQ